MENSLVQIKKALISVSDKTGLDALAKTLHEFGVEIISSGGTGKYLSELGIPYTPIEKVTGNPEAFSGRMKTISFQVGSALLFRRNDQNDIAQAKELNIPQIDLVVCNFYPFEEVAKKKEPFDVLVENIDIGGPTMVRAAAKNFKHVAVSTSPKGYDNLITELKTNKCHTTFYTRQKLSLAAFRHTANYDALVCSQFERELGSAEKTIILSAEKSNELRYGENPHQKGYVYLNPLEEGLAHVTPIQGKEMSYNNLLDADAAIRCTSDLIKNAATNYKSAVTIIKHLNPCGAALGRTPLDALNLAWAADPVSAFGSIICFSDPVAKNTAEHLAKRFIEVIIAPSFSDDAKKIFSKKPNLRLIEFTPQSIKNNEVQIKSISGGYVVQDQDNYFSNELKDVTKLKFDEKKIELLRFGVVACKHLKSNAIAIVGQSDAGMSIVGAGMGNPNRLVSTEQAISKARENGHTDLSQFVAISDAFFPFPDNVELMAQEGLKYIVQPGGSIKDKDVIKACDEQNLAMVFTGVRHFCH